PHPGRDRSGRPAPGCRGHCRRDPDAPRRPTTLAGGGRSRSPPHQDVHVGAGGARLRTRAGGRGPSPAMTPSSVPSTLAVVIVSYRSCQLLGECLESLIAHPPAMPCEIIVVDNASDDGSADLVRQRYPAVRLVANDANLGFARAANQGAAATRGDLV